jgi:hypothetical protein
MFHTFLLPVLSIVAVSAVDLRKFMLFSERNQRDLIGIAAGGLVKCRSDDNECILRVANEILGTKFGGLTWKFYEKVERKLN